MFGIELRDSRRRVFAADVAVESPSRHHLGPSVCSPCGPCGATTPPSPCASRRGKWGKRRFICACGLVIDLCGGDSDNKGRGEKFHKSEKPEKSHKSEKPEKSYKSEKREKSYMSEKPEKSYKSEKPEKSYKSEKREKSYMSQETESWDIE